MFLFEGVFKVVEVKRVCYFRECLLSKLVLIPALGCYLRYRFVVYYLFLVHVPSLPDGGIEPHSVTRYFFSQCET
jgi:hypothetical protein